VGAFVAAHKRRRRVFWACGIILATLVGIPFVSIIFGPMWRMSQDALYVAPQHRFKQMFSAYVDSPYPVFITSDALLAAFHALNEETAVRLETAQAIRSGSC
jgi:hypothetical protein